VGLSSAMIPELCKFQVRLHLGLCPFSLRREISETLLKLKEISLSLLLISLDFSEVSNGSALMAKHGRSGDVLSWLVLFCFFVCFVLNCFVLFLFVCLVFSCRVVSCLVLLCLVLSCLILSRRVYVLSCLLIVSSFECLLYRSKFMLPVSLSLLTITDLNLRLGTG
jgi:hypothetical protein